MTTVFPPKTPIPVLPKPPWKPRNQREADWLIDWTKTRLAEWNAYADSFMHIGDDMHPMPLPTFEYAMEVYREKGDNSLLQQIDPDLAKTYPQIKPNGKRGGGRIPDEKHGDKIYEAIWDTKTIIDIWKEHYDGQFYRSPEKDKFVVTAEQIAMEYNGVTEDTDQRKFEQRLKKYKNQQTPV